jgi:hypothetical protein
MVETAIPNNSNASVITSGTVSGLDTSALTDGDKLYLSPTVAGGWTTTKPSAPNHMVYIGTVTRSHPNQGTIQLRIQNGFELEELHNVAIASVADKDLLAYETSTTLWKNKSASTLDLLTATTAASTYAVTARGLPTGGTANQILSKVDGTNYNVQWATAGGSNDVQAYKTAGTFTWTKPTNAKAVFVFLVGGGGGGGSGAVNATNGARGGGGGGGGGGLTQIWMNAADLASTVTVTVGAGGPGGASRPSGSASSGFIGTNGGNTSFGTYLSAGYGGAGQAGTVAGGGAAGGAATSTLFNFYALTGLGGGAGTTTTGTTVGNASAFQGLYANSGGGGAGAAALSTVAADGGSGGGKTAATNQSSGTGSLIAGGTGGVAATLTAATAGTSTYAFGFGGTGGGGGYYKTVTDGGTGASGGAPGGGGGGGGASNTSNASGAGGTGGAGYALIITV